MQICKLYVQRWLRIFLTIKFPDKRVTTKQACRDERIVSLFFPLSQYIDMLCTLKNNAFLIG